MAGEINWIFVLGMGATLLLLFLGNRVAVPVRQKYQRETRK
jgi:hypothetical protein